jgi:hypothetical protein
MIMIDIDSRPYEAQLERAQGTLERGQNCSRKPRWIWSDISRPGLVMYERRPAEVTFLLEYV